MEQQYVHVHRLRTKVHGILSRLCIDHFYVEITRYIRIVIKNYIRNQILFIDKEIVCGRHK